MADFPLATMVAGPDTAKYSVSVKDPSYKAETDGGYVITRARFTAAPKKTYNLGFTNISEGDKEAFLEFWEAKKGGSTQFTYLDWGTGLEKTVRFSAIPSLSYKGVGAYKRWNIDGITFEEV